MLTAIHSIGAIAILCISVITTVSATELDENLGMLADLVGKQWQGRFEDAEEDMTLFMSWEPIIGGAAVQMSGWSTGSNMTRRNIYYWDRENKRVAYLAMTSNGYVSVGSVQLEDSVLTFLGRQVWPDGSAHDTKSRWMFLPDEKVRVVGYRRDGDKWLPGHKILYEAVDSG